MEPTGFSPPQMVEPEEISSSDLATPEPPKFLKAEGGAVPVGVRAPLACAVPRAAVVVHRDDRTRTRDVRSQAAVSVSSTGSAQAELIRARDLARKRRERLEAEEQEMELENMIAAASSK